jgi:micrococcal nuclease
MSALFIDAHKRSRFIIEALKSGALVMGVLFLFFPRYALSADVAPVMVDYVIDGDTVVLEDHRKVRLIGINAPEQESNNRAAQPYAVEARLALQQLVHGKWVRLIEGSDAVDRYGRTLAYIELEDGTDVQELMLTRGYAAFVAISPNFARITKYMQVEQISRDQSLGIWSFPGFVLRSPVSQVQFTGGFAVIDSIVSRVRKSAKYHIFDLGSGMSVRIAKRSWQLYWNSALPESYMARNVEVRGWFFVHNKVLVTVASHPSMMQIQ